MTQKERMLAELPYLAGDKELAELRNITTQKLFIYNTTNPNDSKQLTHLIYDILGKAGENICVQQPFHCDFGTNIEIGDYFYANYNCTILDTAKVTIGSRVLFGPNVTISTAGHPIHPEARNPIYDYCFGIGITIGDDVWIGANVVVLPGVHIGNNVVIGAGSVVTKDIPDDVIAVGNPCKVLRKITEEDKNYYYKDRVFDKEQCPELFR